MPLVVPEVNGADVMGYEKKRIIANPNCSTAQLVMALKPIHDAVGIKRVVVSTYQAVSGAGKAGMDELWNQTKGIFVNDSPEPQEFSRQIAFNAIPMIGSFRDDGFTDEEKTKLGLVEVPQQPAETKPVEVEEEDDSGNLGDSEDDDEEMEEVITDPVENELKKYLELSFEKKKKCRIEYC